MPTRSQLIAAINTLRGRSPVSPIQDTELADMLETWVDYYDNHGEIDPATFQSQLTDILGTYDEHISTFNSNITAATAQKVLSELAADRSIAAADRADLGLIPKGSWNASTNTPTITATPNPAWVDGAYLDITPVAGVMAFAGENFSIGQAVNPGDRLKKIGTHWSWIKASDLALQKIVVAEPKITSLEAQTIKLTPVITPVARIQQVPSYAYTTYGISTTLKEHKYWFFPKGVKKLDRAGFFIFKRSSLGTINSDIRFQVIHQRSGVNTILLDTTVPYAEFATYDDADSIVDYHNYEYKIKLTNSVTTANGDRIFVSISCDATLNPVYSVTNKDDASGEWNNGTGLYYRVWLPTVAPTYTTVPTLPAGDANPGIVHFYEDVLFLTRLDTIEANVAANSAAIAGKATGATVAIVGTNKFDKATHVQDGEGVGSDGVVFSVAGFGRIKDMPVLPNTTYFISGLTIGPPRGLKFLNAAGATISFIGSPTNNFAFTTPALCVKIAMQIYGSGVSLPQKDTLQIQIGTSATAYESYVTEDLNDKVDAHSILAKRLTVGAKIGESFVADKITTDLLAAKTAALEAVANLGLIDFQYISPANIYLPDGVATTRKEPTLLYLQHFIREKIEVWLNGGKNFIITAKNATNAGTVIQDTLAITLGGGKYLTKNVNINRISVNISALASQFPKVGWIGDSITTFRPRNGSYSGVGAGTIHGMAKEIAEKNRIDAGSGFSYLCMGRSNQGDGTLSYKSNSLTIKQFADGFGGWATSTWLRHPIRMWVFPLGGWDLLGLSTTNSRGYNGSASDNTLISKAIYGVVAPVISANSYNTLISENQISNSLGAWTGSAPQIALVQAWIDGVSAGTLSTVNPYFDYAKSGTNRFNFTKYLAEWKTLAPDGVTPLILGSTAGSKVVSLANHQVCTPTHYLITTGENDRLHVTNPVDIANDIIELATEITTQLPSCKVGVLMTDIPGPMFPERHPNYVGLFSQSDHNNKWDLYKELQTRFGSLASQVANRIYIIPTWFAMQPLSHSFTFEQNDEGSINTTLQIANDDYNHPGYFALRSAGAQVYGWVAYSTTV